MHFTYRDPGIDPESELNLRQGDVLECTASLTEVLNTYHKHYAENVNNRYFLVLTQSCDLVQGRGDPCKARYISIAPARPLSLVVERAIRTLAEDDINVELPVCTEKARSRLSQFLERLLNNNEPDYFYLHNDPVLNFPEPCCTFLRLPIALRAKEHYQMCIDARLFGLNESFQAKLVVLQYNKLGC